MYLLLSSGTFSLSAQLNHRPKSRNPSLHHSGKLYRSTRGQYKLLQTGTVTASIFMNILYQPAEPVSKLLFKMLVITFIHVYCVYVLKTTCYCVFLKCSLLQVNARIVTAGKQKASKTVTARLTGRAEHNRTGRPPTALHVMGVAPPMSSVVVERHHPVTQV